MSPSANIVIIMLGKASSGICVVSLAKLDLIKIFLVKALWLSKFIPNYPQLPFSLNLKAKFLY